MPTNGYREGLRPRIEAAREGLKTCDPEEICRRGGLDRNDERLELSLFGKTYVIGWPDLIVRESNGEPCPEELQILLLDYLYRGDGSPPTGAWIGFQQLPDGAFYQRAFQGYSGDQLVRDLSGDIGAFRRASERLKGEPLPLGDAGYAFRALPHVPLAVVWWAGDEEFPAHATVLFDEVADRYFPTDGLAILGRLLCRRLAREGRGE